MDAKKIIPVIDLATATVESVYKAIQESFSGNQVLSVIKPGSCVVHNFFFGETGWVRRDGKSFPADGTFYNAVFEIDGEPEHEGSVTVALAAYQMVESKEGAFQYLQFMEKLMGRRRDADVFARWYVVVSGIWDIDAPKIVK